jgi:hypothetical protein
VVELLLSVKPNISLSLSLSLSLCVCVWCVCVCVFFTKNSDQADIFNCINVKIFVCLLYFKAFRYFHDIALQKCLLFKEIHDFVTLSLVKVKESHNRPGVAQRVPGVLGSQI